MANKPKPPSTIVDAISLDPDPTNKLLTRMTLETQDGVTSVALTREAVERLWGMLDQWMASWSCDCVDCTAARMADQAAAAERMH